MHPEIEQFWRNANYEVAHLGNIEVRAYLRIPEDRYDDPASLDLLAGACIFDKQSDRYIFDGSEYSEEDMLRIIRLKAFL